MIQPIKVNYQSTNSLYEANQWLNELDKKERISCDFEAAVKYSSNYLELLKNELETEPPKLRRIEIENQLYATALDHPSHIKITHLSVAWSESEAYVFILDNDKITRRILQWLIQTKVKQIWHNASYDFKLIYYATNQMPINYEDTAVLAKTLLNHVETSKATVGLKELAGPYYGDWAISADNFELAQMYEPHVLHYAATDACATYKLWERIQSSLHKGT